MKIFKFILVTIIFSSTIFNSCKKKSDNNNDNNNNPPAIIPNCGTVTDIDGNVYNTVTIGTQCWMRENLKVTHYRNGDNILKIVDSTVWNTFTSGAYCDYKNNANNSTIYGRLYNWYAAVDSRNIAPQGWHVPSDGEWHTLALYLDANAILGNIESNIAGGKLKETGTTHWYSPNTGATNETGFTALPAGARAWGGKYGGLYELADWWSTTQGDYPTCAYMRSVDESTSYLVRSGSGGKSNGWSIRCIKD